MPERQLIELYGLVQGVGFRPFVYSLASALRLHGFVQNRGSHVLIDVEGNSLALATFVDRLSCSPPPPAFVERMARAAAPPAGYTTFEIASSSVAGDADPRLTPDQSTCDDCLAELFDAGNRRFNYPFITCNACGPRFSITREVPFDRAHTTMAAFEMCEDCRAEYENPADRRFHSQTIACAACGPRLRLQKADRIVATGPEALSSAIGALAGGEIVAMKGIGGYLLACDAGRPEAVAELRRRKSREAKPFAVMIPVAAADHIAAFDAAAHQALASRERPITLISADACCGLQISANVAPDCPALGVMLPYTPLHHLLMREIGRALVMTSGNRVDEPIAYDDGDAFARLGAIADLFLWHDRAIHSRCDDSVVSLVNGAPAVVRRGRSYAPDPITLAEPVPAPVLAVGGQMKNTFCLAANGRAYVSPHVGDLGSVRAYTALGAEVSRWCGFAAGRPEIVAHDLHPDYMSTRFAHACEARTMVPVQHHHAHVLSCAAEHGITEPLIGVAFDGAGLGPDGAVWGGEFLIAERAGMTRAAHLAYVPLPGGDAAAREPWRMALAHLSIASGAELDVRYMPAFASIPRAAMTGVRHLIARAACVPTSSAGRLFDAVAAMIGVRSVTQFEGQAAMALEALAAAPSTRVYAFDLDTSTDPWAIHSAPVIRAIARDVSAGITQATIASGFHQAVARMIADVAARIARRTGIRRVALTGGVFQNVVLTQWAVHALERHGLIALTHRRVPCNDGGLSLGQALAAARSLRFGVEEASHACA